MAVGDWYESESLENDLVQRGKEALNMCFPKQRDGLRKTSRRHLGKGITKKDVTRRRVVAANKV